MKWLKFSTSTNCLINVIALFINLFVYAIIPLPITKIIIIYQLVLQALLMTLWMFESEWFKNWQNERAKRKLIKILKELEDENK